MTIRPVEPECRTPVVDDERDVVAEVELVEQAVEIPAVFDERVRVRSDVVEFVRVVFSDEVGNDATRLALNVRHDVAPEVRGGRVAVEEHDDIAVSSVLRSGVVIRHLFAVDGEMLFAQRCGAHATSLIATKLNVHSDRPTH